MRRLILIEFYVVSFNRIVCAVFPFVVISIFTSTLFDPGASFLRVYVKSFLVKYLLSLYIWSLQVRNIFSLYIYGIVSENTTSVPIEDCIF